MPLEAVESYDSGEVSVSADGRRTYVRTFHIDAGDRIIGPLEALSADNLPGYGTFFVSETGEVDANAVCETLSAAPDAADRTTWRVRATYVSRLDSAAAESTGVAGPGGSGNVVGPLVGGPLNPLSPAGEAGGEGGAEGGGGGAGESLAPPTLIEDPLLRPAKWGLTLRAYTTLPEFDLEETRILNSAADQFDPPVEVERFAPVLTVLKNLPLSRISLDDYENWGGAVSAAEWLGRPARAWKVTDLTIDPAYENGVWFWASRWVIAYNPDGWLPRRVLDAGWNERDLDNGGFKAITDALLRQPNSVPLLDGAGNRLDPDAMDPQYREFVTDYEIDFRQFGLFGEV